MKTTKKMYKTDGNPSASEQEDLLVPLIALLDEPLKAMFHAFEHVSFTLVIARTNLDDAGYETTTLGTMTPDEIVQILYSVAAKTEQKIKDDYEIKTH